MKKINKISLTALLLAFALGITGCSEASDTDPDQTKLENTIKTEQGQNNSTSPNSTEGENETNPEISNASEAQTAEKPPIENEQVINGNMVYSYNGHWYGIQLYAGGYNQDLYIKSVNAFADDLEGVAQVYSMVAPTNADFYCPDDYSDYNASQIEDISYIEKSLSSKVKSVNCYDVIKEHIDEYLYFRTDHHWTSDGAYYAAQQFAKAAGVPFKELNGTNYEKKVIEGFVGSLYGSTNDANLLNDPDDFVYYVPNNDFKCYYYDIAYNLDGRYPFFIEQEPRNAFGTFMGADKKIVRVETDVKNSRKLMVIKDSYGNVEIPFYMGSFEEIYVTDVRFFDLNAIDFIKEQGITDVLITMCTYSAAGQNCEGIEMMRTGAGHLINW
ncbi:MAG: hypothetical protein HDT44_08470 [Ruminococcaceae bacterium]|nr:hypothetical protein [Oscillospiraceae bacterium]